jgi:hypothetical protein
MTYVTLYGEKYNSIEDYIQHSINGHVGWLTFKDLKDFESLLEKDLLNDTMQIRTSDRGIIDECYQITKEGMLEGITEIVFYQGIEGIHKPEDILKGERISDGWIVFLLHGRFQYNFKKLNGSGGIQKFLSNLLFFYTLFCFIVNFIYATNKICYKRY